MEECEGDCIINVNLGIWGIWQATPEFQENRPGVIPPGPARAGEDSRPIVECCSERVERSGQDAWVLEDVLGEKDPRVDQKSRGPAGVIPPGPRQAQHSHTLVLLGSCGKSQNPVNGIRLYIKRGTGVYPERFYEVTTLPLGSEQHS